MKITRDNIDDFRLCKRKIDRYTNKNKGVYVLRDGCPVCGDPYFVKEYELNGGRGECCSAKCNNHTNNSWVGRKHKPESIEKMRVSHTGKILSEETREKMSDAHSGENHWSYGIKGDDLNTWRGGKGVSWYDTYQPQLEPYGVECRRSPDDDSVLEVKCVYCDRWMKPTRSQSDNKRRFLDGDRPPSNFYCSDSCKLSCPSYNQMLYPKGFKPSTSREVQPQLRKLVLLRDGYQCVKCGRGVDDIQLHCHHIDSVKNNPIESADVDNCITFCVVCHKIVHQQDGCTYNELRNC
jgi:hypothetical protein